MALVIAGERSGVGKTTVTLALLSALNHQGLSVQSFKVGPDYIDPMFHGYVTGQACRNLDPVLTSEAYVQECFAAHAQADYVLVEGVMGLFDGAKGEHNFASTAHIAQLLNLPVILVIDCSRLSRSVAAIAHGYRTLDPHIQIAGVVLNRVSSDRHLELLKSALESISMPILGVLRRHDEIAIPDRHLGLVPTEELPQLNALIAKLAHLGKTCFDWSNLLPLLKHRRAITFSPTSKSQADGSEGVARRNRQARIAIARDRAFNFYYADNLGLLTELGAELIPWSPMRDSELPAGTQGIYLGGGFPEVFAQELAENQQARQSVGAAIHSGMPTYAECGGLMYLCETLVDFSGQSFPMVGVLPTSSTMTAKLTLGYRQAVALHDSPLMTAGTTVLGHEFHRSVLGNLAQMPLYEVRGYSGKAFPTEGWRFPKGDVSQAHQLHASYIHLHWGNCPALPARFLEYCSRYVPGAVFN
jgi:cobyrinic acid a,c-diamide synthase